MNLDRLSLPHLLCCGHSTVRISGGYTCRRCERRYKLDGTRIYQKTRRAKSSREAPIITWANLAKADERTMIHYALLSTARRFANHSTHQGQGESSRELCIKISKRFDAILAKHKGE